MDMVESDKQFTLLLVDDNPTNLLLLTKIIELDLPEVRVLTATSAMEGLKLSEQDQINGVFVDVQMPQMSGLDMCRRLNENPRTSGIPLVLMTAHLATPEMRAEGLEVGAYDFISQPISNIEMLARIKVMLRLCANEQRSLQNNNNLQQQVEDHTTRLRWVSGLLISGDGPLAEPDQQLLEHLVAVLPAPGALEDQLLFDRLTTDFPLPWRRTLLKISLLDTVPVRLASELSEINNIEAVFDYLHRHELSLIQSLNGEDFLLFKPETKTFLRKKAEQELDEKERQQVYLVAADWFQKQDDLVAALHCLISAEYYSAVAQLLSQFGLALFDKHPQSEILPLFTEISEDICSTCGWLALFRGIHLLAQRRPETVVWLEIAYQLFQDDENSRGQLLTLAQQVFLSLYLDGCFERWATRLAPLRQLAMAQIPVLETTERLKVSYALGMAELF
ncbi:MAG: response regulator, partial [Deltaproteobacteria bacterium]|nr:response regulator [Deltaproteobacteria bacterium]